MNDKDLKQMIEYMKNFAIHQIDQKQDYNNYVMSEIEKKAAKLEVTCDYYIQEFILD